MLTYTALLVACLVVSAVVYFLYRVISDSSRSVYSSRERLALSDDLGLNRREPLKSGGAAYGAAGHAMPRSFPGQVPARPTESINWGWEGSGVQLREPLARPGQGAGHSSHCSLFDTDPTAPRPGMRPGPRQGKLHREEMNRATGTIYKVTRKTQTTPEDNEDLHKPWGW